MRGDRLLTEEGLPLPEHTLANCERAPHHIEHTRQCGQRERAAIGQKVLDQPQFGMHGCPSRRAVSAASPCKLRCRERQRQGWAGVTEFDPKTHNVTERRGFDNLKVGEVYRSPSRTMTEAHF